MPNVTATPAAPPNGSRLLIALPAAFIISAWVWVSPGSDPVITNVYAQRLASQSTAISAIIGGSSRRNSAMISCQCTVAPVNTCRICGR